MNAGVTAGSVVDRAGEDESMTKVEMTVEGLRAVAEYARAWRVPGDLPPVLAAEHSHVDFSAHVHYVPRAVLRELVAQDPDGWRVTHVPEGNGGYFRVQWEDDRSRLALTLYSERDPDAGATL